MPVTRLPDWEERLTEIIRARHRAPFAWGQFDCALFACDAVLAMTGVDLAEPFRGRYADALGALRAIRKFTSGGNLGDVARIQAAAFTIPEVDPPFAMLGDVVLGDGGPLGPRL